MIKSFNSWYDINFCIKKIKEDYDNINFINDINILKYIIKHYPYSLKFLDNQTEEICIIAVKIDGFNLKYIKIKTEEICRVAINNCNLSNKLYEYDNKDNKIYLKCLSNDLYKNIINNDPFELEYIKDQTEEICKLATSIHGLSLIHVKKQTEEICKIAVSNYGLVLRYVINQNDEICKLAVNNDGLALEYVKKQNFDICKIAVENNGLALKFVLIQTVDICRTAINNNELALKYVKKYIDLTVYKVKEIKINLKLISLDLSFNDKKYIEKQYKRGDVLYVI